MSDHKVFEEIKKGNKNAIYHKFQRCKLWAISVLDKDNYDIAVAEWKECGSFTRLIPDVTILSIDGGLPRLDVIELEKTSMMQPEKETDFFWLADHLWGLGVYMSLKTMSYDKSIRRECFDTKMVIGEIVNGNKFIKSNCDVSYKLPQSIHTIKHQELEVYLK